MWIGGITEDMRFDNLEEEFRTFGQCTFKYKGEFAFVEYQYVDDAQDALTALKNKFV